MQFWYVLILHLIEAISVSPTRNRSAWSRSGARPGICVSPSSSFFFPRAREETYGTNNGRFHQKPRHWQTSERTNSRRSGADERGLWPSHNSLFFVDLCFVSLFVPPFPLLLSFSSFYFSSLVLREDRFCVGKDWWRLNTSMMTTTSTWRSHVIMPFAGLKILLACRFERVFAVASGKTRTEIETVYRVSEKVLILSFYIHRKPPLFI